MRKRDRVLLWPVYFDSTKTREEGRKVPRSLAVPSPSLEDVEKAVERSELQREAVSDAKYPKFPWQKTGMISVPKKASKTKILRQVAKELLKMREQARK